MAILNNTSLGFSNGESDCDCRNADFCQIVVKEDNPAWQIVADCNELSGINEKLPCENNIVGSQYFEQFTAADPTHVSVQSLLIDWLGTATAGGEGTVSSDAAFLTVGKFYVVKFTIVGRTQGTLTVNADSFSVYQASDNGNYTFVILANDDVLDFIGSVGETAFDGNMINLFVGCIRLSELYDIISDGGEGDTIWTLPSQTKGCKGAGVSGRLNYRDNNVFVSGQTYKICFTIEDLTAGQVEVLLGSNSGGTFTTNGRFCVEIVYNGSYVPLKGVKMTEAYSSSLAISFDVRGGLLMRQVHHWAALFFTAAISVHLLRVFFTGAFRKPREINWVI
jgi:lipopolysaccharide export system protein LptA